MLKRREFMTGLGAALTPAAWPVAARAQRPRIGVLSVESVRDEGKVLAAFVDGLRALGDVDGEFIDIDYRYADGDNGRLVPLARELIARNPGVVMANAPSPALAMKNVAPDVPIVCPALSDSVVPTLAASYARPGGSVTGLAAHVEGLVEKSFELALDMIPGARRVGFLANPDGASMALWRKQVEAAGRLRDVAVVVREAHTPDALAPAFDGFKTGQAQAVIVPANGLFTSQSGRIAQLALAARLPTVFAFLRDVEGGGLASYGIDQRDNHRRAASYVDKILKGAKPGDLPIEFPTKLMLAVNLKTAKALGLTIPATIIGRADEVIE